MENQRDDPCPEQRPDELPGAPRRFSYPKPIPCSEEDAQRYNEIGDRIVEKLKKAKGRRSRWRPRE